MFLGKLNMEILCWFLFFLMVWIRWLEFLEFVIGIFWLNGGRWWGSLVDNFCIFRYLLFVIDRSFGFRFNDFFSIVVFGFFFLIDIFGVFLLERFECWLFECCIFVLKLFGCFLLILGFFGNKWWLIFV